MSYEVNPGSAQNVAAQLTNAEQAILAAELGLDLREAGAKVNDGASALSAMSGHQLITGCNLNSASAASASSSDGGPLRCTSDSASAAYPSSNFIPGGGCV